MFASNGRSSRTAIGQLSRFIGTLILNCAANYEVGMLELDVRHGLLTREFVAGWIGGRFGLLSAACEQYKESESDGNARRGFMGEVRRG